MDLEALVQRHGDSAAAAAALLALTYALIYVFAAALPGARCEGYVLEWDCAPLPRYSRRRRYRLNGLRVLAAAGVVFAAAANLRLLPADYYARHFAEGWAAACALGLAVAGAAYAAGRALRAAGGPGAIDRRARCPTAESLGRAAARAADAAEAASGGAGPAAAAKAAQEAEALETAEFDARSELEHFWCGLGAFNPTWPGGVDAKMWLYVVGAVMLELNGASLAARHVLGRGVDGGSGGGGDGIPLGGGRSVGFGMAAFAGCLSFFVVEYLANEEVHLQTYDLFRERVGFKLAWGCLCFYPFFYAIGGLPLAERPRADCSAAAAAACVALFFAGWTLTRGANMQKAACKAGRERFAWCGVPVSMATVPGSNGRVLCGGFWGLSRHVNYFGEIVQALALALPAVLASQSQGASAGAWGSAASLMPLLYPLYYVALFIPRQMDDDALCAAKYGKALWGEYVKRVPSRIVPLLY